MTDKPDYSELIERLRKDADHIQRRAEIMRQYADQMAASGDAYHATAENDATVEETKAVNLREAAAALTHLAAENDRLTREADAMIAAGLGARINASMDNGWRDRADELAGLLKAALPWVAHEQPLCDRIVSMLTAPDPCGAVEMPEDAGGSLQKMQIAPAPFNQDAMNAKRPAPPK